MSKRPSEPLLRWLRDKVKEHGLTTAALASKAGLARGHLRKVLTGATQMTVDELLLITQAMGLTPEELGVGTVDEAAEAEALAEVDPGEARHLGPEAGVTVDPWGNQPAQLLRAAFDLGCDVLFVADTEELEASGVPEATLANYRGRSLPIKLEALYHKHNEPVFDEQGIHLTLSFDTLRRCSFPWSCIQQVVFYPAPPPESEPEEEAEAPPADKGAPFLRLVT